MLGDVLVESIVKKQALEENINKRMRMSKQ